MKIKLTRKTRIEKSQQGKNISKRLRFCSIFLKVERTYEHPEWSTHTLGFRFLSVGPKDFLQIATQAQAGPSIWEDGTNSILLSHDLTPVGYPSTAFFRPQENGFKIFLLLNIGIPASHNVSHLPGKLIKNNRSHGLPTETEK